MFQIIIISKHSTVDYVQMVKWYQISAEKIFHLLMHK